MRGLAMLLVLGEHVPVFFTWARIGWMGVGLFFVLSGYLLTGQLLKEWTRHRTISVSQFLWRRAWRILPSYYLFVLFTIGLLVASHTALLHALLSEIFLIQDYLPGVWGITWSLGAEQQFYLFLPVSLLLLIRFASSGSASPFRSLPILTAALAVVCLGLRFYTASRWQPFQLGVHYMPFHLRADSFGAGALLAYLQQYHSETLRMWATRRRWILFFGSILSLTPSFCLGLDHPFTYTVGYSLNWLGYSTLLVLMLYRPSTREGRPSLLERLLAKVGLWSYSIYLWHCPLILLALPWLKSPGRWFVFGVYLAASVGIGALMWRLVEVPTLAYRNKKWPAAPAVS